MAHAVCPWWFGYFLASGLRRLVQDPSAILGPHVTEGMVVFEPGPGMGFFTLELARRVGPRGKVVAVDVQPRMISELRRRAAEAGLAGRVDARVGPGAGMGIDDLKGGSTSSWPSAWYTSFRTGTGSTPRRPRRSGPAAGCSWRSRLSASGSGNSRPRSRRPGNAVCTRIPARRSAGPAPQSCKRISTPPDAAHSPPSIISRTSRIALKRCVPLQ